MGDSSTRIRALTVDAVAAAASFVARPSVAERWDDASALDGMTVGALAAHTLRAAGATIAYLDRTEPDAQLDGEPLTAATYFHAAIEAPIHESIRAVSAEEAAVGVEVVAADFVALVDRLRDRLDAEPVDRMIEALGGRPISLDHFCRTRLVEVLTHLDDLAASLGEDRPSTDPDATAVVIEVLVGVARHVRGDWEVVRALGRSERVAEPVFPVL
ncbi:MAG: maleylpyruvate isomerase N-terminal domain-containing protein [Actinomycetota bacterium]